VSEAVPFLDATILAPISDATPAGRDLTYDTNLEKLAAEIEKATSISGDVPDWGLVRRESARMLRAESKDLRLASWWVAAAAVGEGWNAVAEGATTYKAFVEQFWDGMYPPVKRARARAGLVSWLWEQLAKSLATRTVTIADGDAVRAFESAVIALDAVLTERLGDANAGLGGLRSVVREKIRSIPEPPNPTDPFAAPVPDAQVPASRPGTAGRSLPAGASAPVVTSVGSLEAAEATADGWRASLGTLAHHARAAAPTSPWPYRLARVAAWLTLNAAPEVENGKTFVRAPKPAERADFSAMFDAGAWEALRDASEDAFSEHVLWLDLHRWSAMALERLGPPFAVARESVGRETAALIARLPGLPSLSFSNGSPFASPETVDWLTEEASRFGGSSGGGRAAASSADEATTALLSDAEARITAGQVDEGLAIAIDLANNAANASTRFRAQLQAAKLAHRAGKGELALALLEKLLPQVDATLEAWQPSVCADFYETALKVVRAVSPDWGDRQTLLFRRLLQVDPAAALRIG
jgi:type VI secretion system protein VasJ